MTASRARRAPDVRRIVRIVAVLTTSAAMLACLTAPAEAAAPFAWSAPVRIDATGGQVLSAIACPATNSCTAVDHDEQAVTFDPGSSALVEPYAVAPGSVLVAVACPAGAQCTAVDRAGRATTFDPASPGASIAVSVDAHELYAVACPSVTQCTAADRAGQVVTFDPGSPDTPTPAVVDTQPLLGLACPTRTQCTAVDLGGREVTFDPTAPGAVTRSRWRSTARCLRLRVRPLDSAPPSETAAP